MVILLSAKVAKEFSRKLNLTMEDTEDTGKKGFISVLFRSVCSVPSVVKFNAYRGRARKKRAGLFVRPGTLNCAGWPWFTTRPSVRQVVRFVLTSI